MLIQRSCQLILDAKADLKGLEYTFQVMLNNTTFFCIMSLLFDLDWLIKYIYKQKVKVLNSGDHRNGVAWQ